MYTVVADQLVHNSFVHRYCARQREIHLLPGDPHSFDVGTGSVSSLHLDVDPVIIVTSCHAEPFSVRALQP